MKDGEAIKLARQLDNLMEKQRVILERLREGGHPNAEEMAADLDSEEVYDDEDEKPMCENCMGLTDRSCPRCGQRICKKCAKDHPRRSYGDPPELWPPCTNATNATRTKTFQR